MSGDYKAKVTQVEWLLRSSNKMSILTSNERSVKLWKVSDSRTTVKRTNSEISDTFGADSEWDASTQSSSPNDTSGFLHGASNGSCTGGGGNGVSSDLNSEVVRTIKLPPTIQRRRESKQKCVHTFAGAHPFYIHSVSADLAEEYMITCDEIRINLWSLHEDRMCYKIHDITPDDFENLQVVLTSACFSPVQSHSILFSNTSGEVLLSDLRQTSSITPNNLISFQTRAPRNPVTDLYKVVKGIRSCKFSQDGQYILARDYLSVRVWDVRKPSEAMIESLTVMKEASKQLVALSEQQDIDDKFQLSCSPESTWFSTGGYNGSMKIVDFGTRHKKKVVKELTILKSERSSTFGDEREMAHQSLRADQKVLHSAWHPTEFVCAGACKNTVALFQGGSWNRMSDRLEDAMMSVQQMKLESQSDNNGTVAGKNSSQTPGIAKQDSTCAVISAPTEKDTPDITAGAGSVSSADTVTSTSSRRTTLESDSNLAGNEGSAELSEGVAIQSQNSGSTLGDPTEIKSGELGCESSEVAKSDIINHDDEKKDSESMLITSDSGSLSTDLNSQN